jgi:hypothetical protein
MEEMEAIWRHQMAMALDDAPQCRQFERHSMSNHSFSSAVMTNPGNRCQALNISSSVLIHSRTSCAALQQTLCIAKLFISQCGLHRLDWHSERALAKPHRPFPILLQESTSELCGALRITDLRQSYWYVRAFLWQWGINKSHEVPGRTNMVDMASKPCPEFSWTMLWSHSCELSRYWCAQLIAFHADFSLVETRPGRAAEECKSYKLRCWFWHHSKADRWRGTYVDSVWL